MSDLTFRSGDGRFGVHLPERCVEEMLRHCQDARGRETGGVLIGRYSDTLELAIVQEITGAPPDSRAGRTWFERGTSGLRALLRRRWGHTGWYYLGEWHHHPGAASLPSQQDFKQMTDIAIDPGYACPEPILVIVGGYPDGTWDVCVHLVTSTQRISLSPEATEMTKIASPQSPN